MAAIRFGASQENNLQLLVHEIEALVVLLGRKRESIIEKRHVRVVFVTEPIVSAGPLASPA